MEWDWDFVWQIMPTLHVLTDVYGPRLTGTPSLKAAGEPASIGTGAVFGALGLAYTF